MKFAYTKLYILVTLLIISGCSSEEPDNYQNKNVVRKVIKKPAEETIDWEKTQKYIADIVDKDIEDRINQETVKKPAPAVPKQEKDVYNTKEGDNLMGISGKADIYDDPLKWPFLYRDNSEALSSIKDNNKFYLAPLPANTSLKIVSREKAETNLENRARKYFIINIISSPYLEKLTPLLVKLIDGGHFAYLLKTTVDGKEWFRLRTGFYESRSEANKEGDKIKTLLRIPDIWTVKINEEEFLEFGGY